MNGIFVFFAVLSCASAATRPPRRFVAPTVLIRTNPPADVNQIQSTTVSNINVPGVCTLGTATNGISQIQENDVVDFGAEYGYYTCVRDNEGNLDLKRAPAPAGKGVCVVDFDPIGIVHIKENEQKKIGSSSYYTCVRKADGSVEHKQIATPAGQGVCTLAQPINGVTQIKENAIVNLGGGYGYQTCKRDANNQFNVVQVAAPAGQGVCSLGTSINGISQVKENDVVDLGGNYGYQSCKRDANNKFNLVQVAAPPGQGRCVTNLEGYGQIQLNEDETKEVQGNYFICKRGADGKVHVEQTSAPVGQGVCTVNFGAPYGVRTIGENKVIQVSTNYYTCKRGPDGGLTQQRAGAPPGQGVCHVSDANGGSHTIRENGILDLGEGYGQYTCKAESADRLRFVPSKVE